MECVCNGCPAYLEDFAVASMKSAFLPAPMAKPPRREQHWRYDHDNVTENLQSMIQLQNAFRKDGILTDLTLKSFGKDFPCHKIILASASDYFKAALTAGFKETQSAALEFPNIHADILQVVLEYIYGQKVTLTAANVFDLHSASDFLQISGLIKITKAFMLTNFRECHQHPTFLDLPLPHLMTYISDSNLEVRNEDEVYKAVMRWIRHDLPHREKTTAELIAHVRLPYCSKSFFCGVILKEPHINKHCQEDLRKAMTFHLVPSSIPTKEAECIKPRQGSLTIGFADKSVLKYISMDDGSILPISGCDSSKYLVKKIADFPYRTCSNCFSIYSVSTSDSGVVITDKRSCSHSDCENKCWSLDTLSGMWMCRPKQKNLNNNDISIIFDGTIYSYPKLITNSAGFREMYMLRRHGADWQLLHDDIPHTMNLVDANSDFLLSESDLDCFLFKKSSNNWMTLNPPTGQWCLLRFIDEKLLAFCEGERQFEYYWYNFTEETWAYAGLVEARCSGVNYNSKVCKWRGNLVFTYPDGLALFNPNTGTLRHFISLEMSSFSACNIFPIFIPE